MRNSARAARCACTPVQIRPNDLHRLTKLQPELPLFNWSRAQHTTNEYGYNNIINVHMPKVVFFLTIDQAKSNCLACYNIVMLRIHIIFLLIHRTKFFSSSPDIYYLFMYVTYVCINYSLSPSIYYLPCIIIATCHYCSRY